MGKLGGKMLIRLRDRKYTIFNAFKDSKLKKGIFTSFKLALKVKSLVYAPIKSLQSKCGCQSQLSV